MVRVKHEEWSWTAAGRIAAAKGRLKAGGTADHAMHIRPGIQRKYSGAFLVQRCCILRLDPEAYALSEIANRKGVLIL